MKLKITLIFVIFVIISSNLFGQISSKEYKDFFYFTLENIKQETFKDSTALYTLKIEIAVDKKNNYVPVVTNSDSAVAANLMGLESLKRYNYKAMMGKYESVKFILPVAIVILDTKYNHCINPQVTREIVKMFHGIKEEDSGKPIIYLPPILKDFDKKVY